jgi:hypothetical protein
VAEETKAHLPVNDNAAPAFRLAFRAGERLGNGIANHYIGTKSLLCLRTGGIAGNHRGKCGRANERAVLLSQKLPA